MSSRILPYSYHRLICSGQIYDEIAHGVRPPRALHRITARLPHIVAACLCLCSTILCLPLGQPRIYRTQVLKLKHWTPPSLDVLHFLIPARTCCPLRSSPSFLNLVFICLFHFPLSLLNPLSHLPHACASKHVQRSHPSLARSRASWAYERFRD